MMFSINSNQLVKHFKSVLDIIFVYGIKLNLINYKYAICAYEKPDKVCNVLNENFNGIQMHTNKLFFKIKYACKQ
jgi:hypothetical protein